MGPWDSTQSRGPKGMTTMRPARAIATALLVASVAVAGCARSQPDQSATPTSAPPPATTAPPTTTTAPVAAGPTTTGRPVVLVDGRHMAFLTRVDASRRTITFDLIQFYTGEQAKREASKDGHRQYPAPNDFYIRNVSRRLRTLPVRPDATITVITLAWQGRNYSDEHVPVSLAKLATFMPADGLPFSMTVRNGQVVKIAEVFIP